MAISVNLYHHPGLQRENASTRTVKQPLHVRVLLAHLLLVRMLLAPWVGSWGGSEGDVLGGAEVVPGASECNVKALGESIEGRHVPPFPLIHLYPILCFGMFIIVFHVPVHEQYHFKIVLPYLLVGCGEIRERHHFSET